MGIHYYRQHLAANNLKRCYQLAPPRVRQYLAAEVKFALSWINPGDRVLDLGCGYGRVLADFLVKAAGGLVAGIDSSKPSLGIARTRLLRARYRPLLIAMDAGNMAIRPDLFDVVVCMQNGISAFHVGQRKLIEDALRVARPGGTVLFSTYSQAFWPHRLEWFRLQAAAGLLGEIDEELTGNGVIVCRDGFRATTVSPEQFRELTAGLPAEVFIEEVDGSSLFCRLKKAGQPSL